jgi:4-hydroxybenzoate polyprenyltransferase
MRITHVVTALLLLGVPALGFALDGSTDGTNRVPEPETLILLAAGGVAWMIAHWTKRK